MQIGKVIGNVVATRKDGSLVGNKLLVTQPVDLRGLPKGEPRVMVDTVGAGVGETVLYASGAAARNAAGKPQSCIDAAIVGIVDAVDLLPGAAERAAPAGKEEEILE